jgi:hypothetical protein
MSFRTAALTAIVAISAVTPLQSASAQNYPTKPIHLIVPYPAGETQADVHGYGQRLAHRAQTSSAMRHERT